MSISATLINQFPEVFGSRKVEAYSLVESAPTPTILPGAGAGSATGASATLIGNSYAGQVTLTTGTTIPAGGGTLFAVTLPNQLGSLPTPIIAPGDADSATYQSGSANPYPVTSGSITFSLIGGSITPLTEYIFNYIIPGAYVSIAITSKFLQKPSQARGGSLRDQSFSNNIATLKVRPDFVTSIIEISGVQ